MKFAYATTPGDWVVCYVDAPTAAKRKAGAALATAAFGGWGKMGPVKTAPIAITGGKGKYTLKVDGGKIMTLTTQPYVGLDKSKPIVYSNINSVHSNMYYILFICVIKKKILKCKFSAVCTWYSMT